MDRLCDWKEMQVYLVFLVQMSRSSDSLSLSEIKSILALFIHSPKGQGTPCV